MVKYPQFGVLQSLVLKDDIINHLMAGLMSCCGVAVVGCARCYDALVLHDKLKEQLGDER